MTGYYNGVLTLLKIIVHWWAGNRHYNEMEKFELISEKPN